MIKDNEKLKFACWFHPARVAAVEKDGLLKCWECYLGREAFLRRFSEGYYPDFDPATPPPPPAPGRSPIKIHLPESTLALMDKEIPHA